MMLISKSYSIDIPTSTVHCKISFLFRIELIRRLFIDLYFAKWQPIAIVDEYLVPIAKKDGYLYIVWPTLILCTEPELYRIQGNVNHRKPHRVYTVTKRDSSKKTQPTELCNLDEITCSYDVCQRLDEKQLPRVSLPNESLVFNVLVLVDPIWV